MNLFEWVNSWERAFIFWMGMLGIVFFSIWMGLALEAGVKNFWVPLLEAHIL